jgi:hypothetical protein
VQVANEDELKAGTVHQWVDTTAKPTCGKAYYVVAVYIDIITEEKKETGASTTSWYSTPCP